MRMSIRTEILLSFVFISTIVMILTGTLLFESYKNELVSRIENESQKVLQENRDSFNSLVRQFEMGGSYVGNNSVIFELLNSDTTDELEQDKALATLSDEIGTIYNLTLGSELSSYMVKFFVEPKVAISQKLLDGSKYSLLDTKNISLYKMEEMNDIIWLRETISRNGNFYCFRKDDSSYIYFAKYIKGNREIGERSTFLGVSLVGFDSRQLVSSFEGLNAIDNVGFMILDQNRKMLVKNSKIPEETAEEIICSKILNDNALSNQIEKDGYIINLEKTDIGYTYISFVPKDEIYTQSKKIQSFWLIAILVVSIIIIISSSFVSKHLANPIQKLANKMKSVNSTDILSMNVKTTSNNEMDYLYQSFNELISKVSKLMQEIEQKNLISKELEMNMFQMQINPHFLYNTLDSISWRSMANGQEEIADMVGRLSNIFHYSVKNGSLVATLSEEIDIVGEYISLQQNRYNNKIVFKTEIPDACKRFDVPRCILQPLAENAIIHGNEERNEELVILISAQLTENCMEIFVSNNGNESDVDTLNEYLAGNIRLLNNGELGIKNVNRRILLMYGEKSKLYYKKGIDGKGITAVIHIELEEEGSF